MEQQRIEKKDRRKGALAYKHLQQGNPQHTQDQEEQDIDNQKKNQYVISSCSQMIPHIIKPSAAAAAAAAAATAPPTPPHPPPETATVIMIKTRNSQLPTP